MGLRKDRKRKQLPTPESITTQYQEKAFIEKDWAKTQLLLMDTAKHDEQDHLEYLRARLAEDIQFENDNRTEKTSKRFHDNVKHVRADYKRDSLEIRKRLKTIKEEMKAVKRACADSLERLKMEWTDTTLQVSRAHDLPKAVGRG